MVAILKYPAVYTPEEVDGFLAQLGIDPAAMNNPDAEGFDPAMETLSNLYALMIGHLRHMKNRGDIQFTPTSIREGLDRDDSFEDWMQESIEEYLYG